MLSLFTERLNHLNNGENKEYGPADYKFLIIFRRESLKYTPWCPGNVKVFPDKKNVSDPILLGRICNGFYGENDGNRIKYYCTVQ